MYRKALLTVACLALSGPALAAKWHVEIRNVTPGQNFTPFLVATHYGESGAINPGEPASDGLSMLAEGGITDALAAEIEQRRPHRTNIVVIDGLTGPGQTAQTVIRGFPGQRLTLAAMLVPTNDTFVAIDSVFLPLHGETVVQAIAYDAGTEGNDQNCANMPGPGCGGAALSPMPADTDEGFVHVSNGFHDLGDTDSQGNTILKPAEYTWNNPVAIITIRRAYGPD